MADPTFDDYFWSGANAHWDDHEKTATAVASGSEDFQSVAEKLGLAKTAAGDEPAPMPMKKKDYKDSDDYKKKMAEAEASILADAPAGDSEPPTTTTPETTPPKTAAAATGSDAIIERVRNALG